VNAWARLANYGSGFEADFAVERLRGAGIEAVARGNDIVGIVGAGFQGTTARGVDVMVLERDLESARAILDGEGPEAADTEYDAADEDGDESELDDDV
jgi:hypothetical protein